MLLRKKVALFLFALIAGLGVSEVLVRNLVLVRNVGPSFTVYDPYYGKTLKKNFSTVRITPEFTMSFTTNSNGFRGPEPRYPSARPILCLGDSFTMGYGVNDGEEFPALIHKALSQRSLKDLPVINAGIGDSGNGRWVKFLQTEAWKYTPHLVVIQIHANDFHDNIRERLFDLSAADKLIELPVPAPGTDRIIQSLLEHVPGLAYSYLIGLGRQLSWPSDWKSRAHATKSSSVVSDRTLIGQQLLSRLLEEVLRLCEDQQLPILAVLADIPDDHLVKMQRFFSSRDVPTVAIPTKQSRPDLYYKVDGHWNASGHRFTAARIVETIVQLHLLD